MDWSELGVRLFVLKRVVVKRSEDDDEEGEEDTNIDSFGWGRTSRWNRDFIFTEVLDSVEAGSTRRILRKCDAHYE